MDAKIVQGQCSHCHEPIQFNFNVDDYSTEISIVNGKKTEKRVFMKVCPHCHKPNVYVSDKKEDWGSRKGMKVKTLMLSGGFSCLLTFIVIGLVAFFAIKGIITIFNWIF